MNNEYCSTCVYFLKILEKILLHISKIIFLGGGGRGWGWGCGENNKINIM